MEKSILIIKEASLITDGVIALFEDCFPDYKIFCRSSKHTKEVIQLIREATLVMIDLRTNLDVLRILNTCKKLKKKTIIVTANIKKTLLKESFKMKFDGYIFSGIDKEDLLLAVNSVLVKNKKYIDPRIGELLLNSYADLISKKTQRPLGVLSEREWEVLELITQGLNNVEIGGRLFITDKTVKNHVSNILTKLKVRDRTRVAIMAYKNNWIDF